MRIRMKSRLALLFLLFILTTFTAAQQPNLPTPSNPFRGIEGKTVMIISPHPDDDIIGAAGALSYLSGHNNKVITIFLTSGEVGTYDPALKPERLRAIRMKEAGEAYKALGFNDAEQVWFGYPDDGLDFAPMQEVPSAFSEGDSQAKAGRSFRARSRRYLLPLSVSRPPRRGHRLSGCT